MALNENVKGVSNIAIGSGAGESLNTGNNNIYIGNAGNSVESDIIRIGTPGSHGDLLTGNVYCGGTFTDAAPGMSRRVFNRWMFRPSWRRWLACPSARWQYTNDVTTPHVGSMAQDFYAAFDIGPDIYFVLKMPLQPLLAQHLINLEKL